jgi:hypothetical protein
MGEWGMRDAFNGIDEWFMGQRLEYDIPFLRHILKAIEKDLSVKDVANDGENTEKNTKPYPGGQSGGKKFHGDAVR